MRRWTRFLALALCILSILTLSGCGGLGGGKASKTVAVLFPDSSEIWRRSGSSLQDSLQKVGFVVDLRFAKTANEQTEQFRNAVNQEPLTIIIGAVDGKTLKDTLAEAAAQGIPVIAYDRLIMDSPHVSYFVGFDAEEIGRMQARSIERALRLKDPAGSDNIEIFAGDPEDSNSYLFYNGAMEILSPYLGTGRLHVPSGEAIFKQTATEDWNAEKAKARMERILQSDYANGRPIGAILSPNDNLAGGIREALELHYKGKWPFITGLDADPEGIRAIADGRQGMTIDKSPALPVKECLRLVQEIEAGQSVPTTSKVNNGMREVPAFLCKPSVIYKSNLKSVHKANEY